MLKIVIVDDEILIRQGLSNHMDWESLDMTVIGIADSARACLEICERELPDIIITDINMPQMSGLDMIEYLNRRYPKLFFVIISGYDEFEFAQKAIRLGVTDYLIKPIDQKQFRSVMHHVGTMAKSNKQIEQDMIQLEDKTKNNEIIVRNWVFHSLLVNKNSDGIRQFDSMLKDYEKMYCATLLIQNEEPSNAQNIKNKEEGSLLELHRIAVQSIGKDHTGIVLNEGDNVVVCLLHERKEAMDMMISAVIHRIRQTLEHKKGMATIAVGGIQSSVMNLGKSYQQAVYALRGRFLKGKNTDIFYSAYDETMEEELFNFESVSTKIAQIVMLGDKESVSRILDEMHDKANGYANDSYLFMQLLIQNILCGVASALNNLGLHQEECHFNPIILTKEIMAELTANDMIEHLKTVLFDVIDQQAALRSKQGHMINRAKLFIECNYTDGSLTLEKVAQVVNVSSSHFCYLFKQETGETYVDYLSGLRISKAKELLRHSEYKNFEVASIIGYENAAYFSRVFKKLTGLSPNEFRSQSR